MKLLTHKVIVPRPLSGDHEEAEESVRKQHLNFLVEAGQVALGIVTLVCVLASPLEPAGRQFVGGERAGSRSKTTNTNHQDELHIAPMHLASESLFGQGLI